MHREICSPTRRKRICSLQHPNALAILAGIVSGADASALAKAIMTAEGLAPASIYFKYYLHQAYVKAGYGNEYLKWLDIWNENIKMGLTTWAEISDVAGARSDCHAWGSSPNVEFYRTVLGIDSNAPGFKKVRIEPRLGELKKISGTMAHPLGSISVNYASDKKGWKIDISLPDGIDGEFVWNGKSSPLNSGRNQFTF